MRPRLRRTWPIALVVLLGLSAAVDATDRLVLDSGGSILVERWWNEGDWLRYDSQGGTIGIPRSSVVRIDRDVTDSAPPPRPVPRPAKRKDPRREELVAAVREGHALLESRDLEGASAAYYRLLLQEPRILPARVGYIVAEMALGRDGLALSAVREGLVLSPGEPRLFELLGDLHYRDDQVENALDSWKAAFAAAPSDRLRDKIVKGERDHQASAGYDFAATSHFNVRYDGDVDLELAAETVDYLEERYWTLVERFDHAPPQPITVLLYPSRQFRDVTRAAEGVGGLFDGKIRVPLGGLHRLNDPARRVLVHELTHAVVHSKTRGNCPRWLHEGLAQILDGSELGVDGHDEVVAALESGDAPSWELKGFSYPLALSLTSYIESLRGFEGLVDLLDLLAAGEELDAALERLYGEPYEGLRMRWTRSTVRRAGR